MFTKKSRKCRTHILWLAIITMRVGESHEDQHSRVVHIVSSTYTSF